jgi:hypothetical protein
VLCQQGSDTILFLAELVHGTWAPFLCASM